MAQYFLDEKEIIVTSCSKYSTGSYYFPFWRVSISQKHFEPCHCCCQRAVSQNNTEREIEYSTIKMLLLAVIVFIPFLDALQMSRGNGVVGEVNGCSSSVCGAPPGCWMVGLCNARAKYLTAETFGFKINANGKKISRRCLSFKILLLVHLLSPLAALKVKWTCNYLDTG